MLELLDVAIGFATVMLAVSLIIMSVTQAISSVLALRGAKLQAGLQQLITQTAPTLAAQAKTISEAMLKHPLISDASTRLSGRWQLASAIKKEELLAVLDAVVREHKLTPLTSADERKALVEAGFDVEKVLTQDDLVKGDDVFVAATGVTGGSLLRGVRVGEAAVETESIVMRSRSGTVRTVSARHPSGKVRRLRTEGGR